jgi:hypothetical protein
MLKKLETFLLVGNVVSPTVGNSRRFFEYLLCFGFVAVLGYLDYLTGLEIVIFSFYLIPIRLASVRLGMLGGILVSMSAALAWGVSDYFAGQMYSNQLVILWNMLMRLFSFFIVAWLSARNAALFSEERATSAELRRALSEIKLLQGLLPICAGCKKIRDKQGEWNAVERYIQEHSEATFTHSMCPDCAKKWAREAGIEDDLK